MKFAISNNSPLSNPSTLTYLGFWFDGDKDVGQQRLRSQRAVKSDNSSQEGPKHHNNVYVPVKTDETNSC